HAALHRTQSVQALVMLCALPRFVRAPYWPHGMDAETFTTFGDELARDYRGTLERFIALETLGSDNAATELRLLRAQVFAHGEPSPLALQQGLRLLEQTDLRADLPSLKMPSLWLAGRRDRLADWRAMQASATLAPNARFHRIEGAAHAPFLTHVDEVSAQVLAFLAHVDAASFASAPAAVA
ncbi:MAG: alpha/beta fold hydrolase, partial [Lysobacteraceae bacterium]